VWTGRTEEEHTETERHSSGESGLDSEQQRHQERHGHRGAVPAAGPPSDDQRLAVHQAEHGHDDDGREHGGGKVVEGGCQHQCSNGHHYGGDDRGDRRTRTRLEVHSAPGEAPSHWECLEQPGRDVRGADGNELLVRADPLPRFRRECLRYGDALHVGDESDGDRRWQDGLYVVDRQGRDCRHRQPARDLSEDPYAMLAEAGEGAECGDAGDDEQGAREPAGEPPDEEQTGDADRRHRDGQRMGCAGRAPHGLDDLWERLGPLSLQTEQILDLTRGDDDCRRGGEAGQDRMRHEVDQCTQP
jgi:hypothetical protein